MMLTRWLAIPLLILSLFAIQIAPADAQSETFVGAWNLGSGGSYSVDGVTFYAPGTNGQSLTGCDTYFDAGYVPSPSVGANKAAMLRQGNSNQTQNCTVNITASNGFYNVYLYLVVLGSGDENDVTTVTMEGQSVGSVTNGSSAGWWERRQFQVQVSDGTLNISYPYNAGTILRVSGVQLYSYTPTATPTFTPSNTPTITPTPTNTPIPTNTPTPTLTPTPTSTPSVFITATNRMLTSSNDWLSVFIRIFALIIGLALALLILNIFRRRIVGAIQGSTQSNNGMRPVIKEKRKRR